MDTEERQDRWMWNVAAETPEASGTVPAAALADGTDLKATRQDYVFSEGIERTVLLDLHACLQGMFGQMETNSNNARHE